MYFAERYSLSHLIVMFEYIYHVAFPFLFEFFELVKLFRFMAQQIHVFIFWVVICEVTKYSKSPLARIFIGPHRLEWISLNLLLALFPLERKGLFVIFTYKRDSQAESPPPPYSMKSEVHQKPTLKFYLF